MVLLRWAVLGVLLCLLQQCTTQLTVDQPESGSGLLIECPPGDYRCPTGGLCLPGNVRCNGVVDCPGGEDELLCVDPGRAGCRPDQISCGLKTCLSRAVLCDGVEDCRLGLDERNCPAPPPGSICAGNQFECRSSRQCIPLVRRCDGTEDCQGGEDERTCEFPQITSVRPAQVMANAGENITLTCVVDGDPPPFITWRKDLVPLRPDRRLEVRMEGGVGTLTIFGARAIDNGDYTCEVVSALHGTQLSESSIMVNVTDATPFQCQNHEGTQFAEGTTYYNRIIFTMGPASQAAADVIFVVDESGSMVMEHEWIRTEVDRLDTQFRERGVGVGNRQNQFALVGFARNSRDDITGIVLSQLTTPAQFITASNQLQLTGLVEDGYAAIDFALENIPTRSETAKIMILITDEDRSILRLDLSREMIEQSLRREGFILNAVVNQGFLSDPQDNTSHALGLDGNGTSYIIDQTDSNLFASRDGGTYNPNPAFGFGSTFRDYVQLAFATGGVAWDLNQLREQGLFAEAFTNAFTQVKVDEVMNVSRICFSCFCSLAGSQCTRVDVEDCSGEVPVLNAVVTPVSTTVSPGTMVTFQCLAHTNDPTTSLEFSWRYPQQPPGTVVVMGNTLTVMAADVSSAGAYVCTVNNTQTGMVASANGTLEIAARCILPDGRTLQTGESAIVISLPTANLSRAADVILIVDESGSMVMEHAWIANMTQRLDEALMSVNIGVNPQNHFGIVGFGSDCGIGELLLGRVVTSSDNQVFTTAEGIEEFTFSLNTSGRREDGYSGIKTALDSYEFRDVARQFILITDEDRDDVRQDLTRENIQDMLVGAQTLLNVAVSEEFIADNLRALGIGSNGNAYVYDPSASSLYRTIQGVGMPIADSAHGSTNRDYTQLALDIGGGAWDLSQLRTGGTVAEAFTNAFVQVKVVEIRSQMEECMNCTCTLSGTLVCTSLPRANFSECVSRDPPLANETAVRITVDPETATVTPGAQQMFTCEANSTATLRWTFNGGLLPKNVFTATTGDRNSTLTIMGATATNAGVYACLGHSSNEAFSDVAIATVEFYDPSQDLMLELFPLSHRIAIGDSTNFTCRVPSPASFTWTFEDGPIPSNAVQDMTATESTLTITSAVDSNTGEYTCTVNNTMIGVVNEDTAYLDVTPAVLRLSVLPQSTTVIERTLVQYMCRVDCYPGGANRCPMFPQWSREAGEPLPPQATVSTTIEVDGSQRMVQAMLTIPDTQLADGGVYMCTAGQDGRNATEPPETMAILCVTEAFRVVIPEPPTATVQLGTTRALRCECSQNVSRFTWTFNGMPVRVQGDPDETPGIPINVVVVPDVSPIRSVLVIMETTAENSGTYQCRAVSPSGEVAVTTVTVAIEPLFTSIIAATTTTPTLGISPAVPPTVSPAAVTTTVSVRPTLTTTLIASPSVTPVTSPPVETIVPSPLLTDVFPSVVPTPTPTVLPPFSVTISPQTLELGEGMSETIRCQITHPGGSFEWRRDFGSLPSNVIITEPNSFTSELTIYNMTQQNTGNYQCTATSSSSMESRTVFTTLIFIETLAIVVGPQGSIAVNESSRVELTCRLDCGCGGTTLTWTRYAGLPLPPSAMVSQSAGGRTVILTFEQATVDVAGVYVCNATNDRLGVVTKHVLLNVIVKGNQSVTVSPNSVQLPAMSDFYYTCTAGSPTVSFQWAFNFVDPLPSNAIQQDVSSVTSQLFIQNVTQNNAGAYFCMATYSDGNTESAFAHLIFLGPSPTIAPNETTNISIYPPTSVTLPDGANFTYTAVTNSQVQSFLWRFNFGELPRNALPRNTSSTSSQLAIRNATQSNAGTYICTATFANGDVRSSFVQIIYREPLRVVVTPSVLNVTEGSQVQFDCSCACSGDVVLTWTRSGTDSNILPATAIITRINPRLVSLSFEMATVDIAGTYRCTATKTKTVPDVQEVRLVVI